ncbi:stage II sporulation protein P [Paenibacillus sp. GCM10012307]|uniref:Stage II sporulation protein P n=1 Tax=Paenibacillus roseus TaxID=2798579 RepID=A0A934J9G6_9BACL|nr:stage II sporulation protein P [Paenibacillus roseus]MBJ6363081.1 stage II sporulation protein P [Paenibacillus roseus]
MKRWVLTLFRQGSSEPIRQLLVTGKAFAALSFSSMIFFIAAGLGGMLHQQASTSPVSSMKGFASSVSSGMFTGMLGMEIPAFEGQKNTDGAFSGTQTAAFMLRMLTNVNPHDPRSLIASELPGLGADDAVLLRSGTGSKTDTGPKDRQPLPAADAGDAANQQGNSDGKSKTGEAGKSNGKSNSVKPPVAAQPPRNNGKKQDEVSTPDAGRKKVLIYHSHPRESWYAVGDNNADSKTDNITLVGKRLAEKLEEVGIGALHSNTDYSSAIKNYRWELSYKYSKETVKSAMAAEPQLKFYFDVHRDSQRRKHTTATINGKDYAQLFFIIGHRNPDWEKNEAFATKIHNALEKEYPGISRGVWGKTAATGNGEYNQSLSEQSVLIEVGGVDNTLEESYRTVDALAKIVSEIYYGSEKVEKVNTKPAA